jgi:hypothetical protein
VQRADPVIDDASARAVLVTVVFALAAAAQLVIFALRRMDLALIDAVAYRGESLYDPEDSIAYTFFLSFGLDTVVLIAMVSAWLFWLAGASRRGRAAGDEPPSFSLPFAALLQLVPFVDIAGPWLVLRAFAADRPAPTRRWLDAFSLAWGAGHLAAFASLVLAPVFAGRPSHTCPEMSRPVHRGLNYCRVLIRSWLDLGAAGLVLVAAVLGIVTVWIVRATPRRGESPG